MARARNIKPGFFENEDLVELSFATRLLFIGLWTLADREGRLEDRPKRIKMALFPADNIDVDEALNDLQTSGFLLRYEIDSCKYIQIISFTKHQNPHRDEKASSIPEPIKHDASTVQAPCKHSANPADSLIPDSLIPDTRFTDSKPSAQKPRLDCSPELFEEFWTNYPRRPGSSKADSLKAWKARIKDGADPLIIVEAAAKYATYCQATATEPQFIKQPATFLGPGKHYESNWTPPPRASPRMSHNDASKLSAARTIFGTEVEGTANATGRIIDITPTAAGSLGSEDFPRDAGQLRLAVSEPVENWAGR